MPESTSGTALLQVRGLTKQFALKGTDKTVQACNDVTLDVFPGDTLGLVGESGSGKTTLGRCMLRLIEPTSGTVVFAAQDMSQASKKQLRALRRDLRIVFQEPMDSLNPRMTIGQAIAQPLKIHTDLSSRQRAKRVRELLTLVGVPADLSNLKPRELSAGVAQRCSIARAIATDPKLIVLDEPTSALAPEAEAELIVLLRELQARLGVAYVFISHNLALVGEICNRVAVMYLSQVVEIGSLDQVFANPQHPYTRALLAATLRPDPGQRLDEDARWERLGGEIPSPIDLPQGCYLSGRCLFATDRCRSEAQSLQESPTGSLVRCWRAVEGIDAAAVADARATSLAAIHERRDALAGAELAVPPEAS
ncbi:MAG: ABC transporter ATP-binding protein [Nocardioidaceae bacterium]